MVAFIGPELNPVYIFFFTLISIAKIIILQFFFFMFYSQHILTLFAII